MDNYQNGLQDSYCILALELLVVREPVDQLHHQRFKELPGYLEQMQRCKNTIQFHGISKQW